MTVVLSFTCFKQTLFSAAQVIAGMNLRSEEVVLGQGTLRPDLIESASGLASNKVSSSRYSKKSLEIFYISVRKRQTPLPLHLVRLRYRAVSIFQLSFAYQSAAKAVQSGYT